MKGHTFLLIWPQWAFYRLMNVDYGTHAPSEPSTEASQWQQDEWKIHASLVRPEDSNNPEAVGKARQNIAKAWKLAAPVVMKYGIKGLKIIAADCIATGFNAVSNKNLVFYYGQHDDKDIWSRMLLEIEAAWKEHGVEAGNSINGDIAVRGSSYFYYSRGKKDGKRLEVERRVPALLTGGPFESISIA